MQKTIVIEPIRKRYRTGRIVVGLSKSRKRRAEQWKREGQASAELQGLCQKYPDVPMLLFHNLRFRKEDLGTLADFFYINHKKMPVVIVKNIFINKDPKK